MSNDEIELIERFNFNETINVFKTFSFKNKKIKEIIIVLNIFHLNQGKKDERIDNFYSESSIHKDREIIEEYREYLKISFMKCSYKFNW